MKSLAIKLFTLVWLSCGISAASDSESPIRFDNVTYSSDFYSITFKVSEIHGKPLEISADIDGKKLKIESQYLFGASDVIFSSLEAKQERTTYESGTTKEANHQGKLSGKNVAIAFKFGGWLEHGSEEKNGKKVKVYNVLRLVFKDGNFVESELAVPRGDFSNKWDIFAMSKGEKKPEKPYTTVDRVECPLLRSDEEDKY